MANKKQLDLLIQSIDAWDKARKGHSDVVDLTNASLIGADLRSADLRRANLHGADLSGADLRCADLIDADLRGANLNEADLDGADLVGTDLRRTRLRGAYLHNANLSKTDLRSKNLNDCVLDGANLTGTKLWEIQQSGWSIKGVVCEYAYWDREGEEKKEYQPGEFERLHSDKLKIVLHYKDGINPLEIATLPALIQILEKEHSCRLRIQSIEDDAGGAAVTVVVEDEIDGQRLLELQKEASKLPTVQRQLFMEQEIRSKLEKQVLYLEGQVQFAEKVLEILKRDGKSVTKNVFKGPVGVGIVKDKATANVNQMNYVKNDLETIKALMAEITNRRSELEDNIVREQLIELDASVKTIQAQLPAPKENPSIIKEALSSVRTILEGAAGKVLGSEWLTRLQSLG